ncbi:response regulator [bacterium]|nr:response regulator [bacterium]MBU1636482.1 response regulator [bacterium]MBU1920261.1 response regulator [bacterium]
MARVLIVDDDKNIGDVLLETLTFEGYEPIYVEDGSAAMNILREQHIDVTLMDIIMPKQEGLQTIRQIRKEFPEVPIIAMSGGGRVGPTNYLTVAKLLGARYAFTKPINNEELLHAINVLIKECQETHS